MLYQNKEGTLEEKWRHCYVPERPGLCGGMDREKKQKTCGDCLNNHQSTSLPVTVSRRKNDDTALDVL